jgi:hypothetical protein
MSNGTVTLPERDLLEERRMHEGQEYGKEIVIGAMFVLGNAVIAGRMLSVFQRE